MIDLSALEENADRERDKPGTEERLRLSITHVPPHAVTWLQKRRCGALPSGVPPWKGLEHRASRIGFGLQDRSMIAVLLAVHLIVILAMIGVILLQKSEGGGLGMGGGGMSGFMTGRSTANLLTRVTAIFAAAFMTTSVLLVVVHNREHAPRSILEQGLPAGPAAPSPPAAPIAPAAPPPASEPTQPSAPLAR